MKSMQLNEDNILEFLKFIEGGEYTYDPKGESYVYCDKADINVQFGEYAIYDKNDNEKIHIWNEEIFDQYTIPPKVIELIRMLNVLFPYIREGVSTFNLIDDLTRGVYDVTSENGVYEMDELKFKLTRKALKFTVKMIDND